MKKYFLYRIFMAVPVLLGISLITFILGVLSPGDPAELVLNQSGLETPTDEQIMAMRKELCLDKPIYVQYFLWFCKVIQGNLGISYINGKDILQEILIRLPVTIELACIAMILTTFLGIFLGIICAFFRDSIFDHIMQLIINILLSIPSFWLALVAILIFCEFFRVLPTSGNDTWKHFILPALTLSFSTIAIVCQFIRDSLIKEFDKQYFIVAQTRRISEVKLIFCYALPNVIFPTIALLGNYFASVLGGSVIVESIFALPGISSMALEAIKFRDYPVLQAYVLITGWCYVLVNLMVDFILFLINPKVRAGTE